jgi:asparagine synthase (glutamine-hydrolysing)
MAGLALAAGGQAGNILRLLGQLDLAQSHRGGAGHWLLAGQADTEPHVGSLPVVPPSNHTRSAIAAAIRGGSAGGPATPRRVWAAVDGFFTNHHTLATDLGLSPQVDPSRVVAAAYERWGDGCVERFDGQWALIICDLRRTRALAARDHLGVGQLYFSETPDLILVASEPRSVASVRVGGFEIEPVRFGQFLNGFPPSTTGLSFFRGVQSIPAGAALHVELDAAARPRTSVHRFWDPSTLVGWSSTPPPFAKAAHQFERLLSDAVHQRCTVNERATLLSGGLDSSVIAALAARSAGTGRVPSFSILHENPDLSEEHYVRAVAVHANLESCTSTIRPADAWDVVDAVVAAQGEPLLGQDLIGQWLAYTLAAEHGAVAVLDGIGADELLAGVGTESRYLRELLARGAVIELARELRTLGTRHDASLLRTIRRYLMGPARQDLTRALPIRRYRWMAREMPTDPYRGQLSADVAPTRAGLNRYLYRHVRHQNAPTVLARLDRCAAARGIRPLVPFLDRRVVEWCLPMPAHYKVFRGQTKRLLHAIARRHLPIEVADRRDKRGIVPSSSWMPMRTEYADALSAVPHERRVRESGWIEPREAEHFIQSYLAHRHDDHLAVWRLFTAWRWLELFHLA